MAVLPPTDIERDQRGWHVRKGEIQLEGGAPNPGTTGTPLLLAAEVVASATP
jgi:hypothetical protein